MKVIGGSIWKRQGKSMKKYTICYGGHISNPHTSKETKLAMFEFEVDRAFHINSLGWYLVVTTTKYTQFYRVLCTTSTYIICNCLITGELRLCTDSIFKNSKNRECNELPKRRWSWHIIKYLQPRLDHTLGVAESNSLQGPSCGFYLKQMIEETKEREWHGRVCKQYTREHL
jgi:hypothetical protein